MEDKATSRTRMGSAVRQRKDSTRVQRKGKILPTLEKQSQALHARRVLRNANHLFGWSEGE